MPQGVHFGFDRYSHCIRSSVISNASNPKNRKVTTVKITFQSAVIGLLGLSLVIASNADQQKPHDKLPMPTPSKSQDARRHYEAAVTFQENGQTDQAIQEYKATIRFDPQYAPAHSNLGALLDDKGQSTEAIKECRIAVKLAPKVSVYHNNLGSVLGNAGLDNEALKQCHQDLLLDPHNGKAHLDLGIILYNVHQRDQAHVEWQKATHLGNASVRETAQQFLAQH
jgi:tetratricopeptide (TPR) repeat protein